MNENTNTNYEEMEEMEYESYEGSSSGVVGTLLKLGVGAVLGGIGVACIKGKDKIKEASEQRRIANLEKKGYSVVKKPENVVEGEIVEETKDKKTTK